MQTILMKKLLNCVTFLVNLLYMCLRLMHEMKTLSFFNGTEVRVILGIFDIKKVFLMKMWSMKMTHFFVKSGIKLDFLWIMDCEEIVD